MIDTTTATLTLERFAALPPARIDTIAGGVLLARIHRRNRRRHGDEEVLTRALVFIPHPAGYLARLTIRTGDIALIPEYAELLRIVESLPVIELKR